MNFIKQKRKTLFDRFRIDSNQSPTKREGSVKPMKSVKHKNQIKNSKSAYLQDNSSWENSPEPKQEQDVKDEVV